MNRLEQVRELVDKVIESIAHPERKRYGFVHLYGVSATCVLLARTRGLDEEISAVAGMLHDLATYETGDSENHGPRSAIRAKQILSSTDVFSDEEIRIIQSAISTHSDKANIHGPYEELLKDADVLQHDLCNPSLNPYSEHEGRRRIRLRESLQ
jgi:uncharacterized protein